MVRLLVLCFLVLTALPAQARFISTADYGRLKNHLHTMQSSMARAHRAVDDRTPDELRFALRDMRKSLADSAVLFKKFRRSIEIVLDELYQQNASYGHPKMWPDNEASKLDRYRSEAADITSAEKIAEFALEKVDLSLQRLTQARESGQNPLDLALDMYQTSMGDLDDYMGNYRELIVRLGNY